MRAKTLGVHFTTFKSAPRPLASISRFVNTRQSRWHRIENFQLYASGIGGNYILLDDDSLQMICAEQCVYYTHDLLWRNGIDALIGIFARLYASQTE